MPLDTRTTEIKRMEDSIAAFKQDSGQKYEQLVAGVIIFGSVRFLSKFSINSISNININNKQNSTTISGEREKYNFVAKIKGRLGWL
jgi:glutamate formiminotransferase